MNAGRELDRKIAEMLGWSDFEEVDYFVEDYGGYYPVHDDLEGLPPNGKYRALIPRYSTFVDDAVLLWQDVPDTFTPRLVRMIAPKDGSIGYAYKAAFLHNETMESVESVADSPALAICEAWLAYKNIHD